MKRRYKFAIFFSLATVGGWAVSACVGDEPAEVTPKYLYAETGPDKGDVDVPDVDAGDNGPWTPARFGDQLVLWLDAVDTSTVTRVNGYVTQWKDKSHTGNHFAPPSASVSGKGPILAESGINGQRAMEFRQSEKLYLGGAPISQSVGAAHVFLVVQTKTIPAEKANALWRFGDHGPNVCYYPAPAVGTNPDRVIYDGFGSDTRFIAAIPPPEFLRTPHVYSVISTVHDWLSFLDGKQVGKGSSAHLVKWDPLRTSLGASGGEGEPNEFFDGVIGELVLVDHPLAPQELNTMQSYLSKKWGITMMLPDGGASP